MMTGGIRAVRTVISYRSRPRVPKAHITPIITTQSDMKVARNDRKKKKKIREVTARAAKMNIPISSMMFWAFMVRM